MGNGSRLEDSNNLSPFRCRISLVGSGRFQTSPSWVWLRPGAEAYDSVQKNTKLGSSTVNTYPQHRHIGQSDNS